MFGLFVMGLAFFFPIKAPNEAHGVIKVKLPRKFSVLPTCPLYAPEFTKEKTSFPADSRYYQLHESHESSDLVDSTQMLLESQPPPPPPINYGTCYTAPDESFMVSRYYTQRVRERCSESNLDILRSNSNLENPKIECVPGFTEVQSYYSLDLKSSPTIKYGDYWCNVRRVCCR